MKLAALNAHATAARSRVDALEQELAAAYLKALRSAGRKATSRFRSAASLAAPALTAATDPKWLPPDPGQLLDQQALAAQARKNAAPIQERALRLAVPVGISFDLANPLARQFLGGLADRSQRILAGFSGEIGVAIGEAHGQGLSVAKAAQLLRARVESASVVQATLLARSDLVSIANGGSLLAAQLVADASGAAGEESARFKTWLTAGDERVRDTHAEADGQTVPLDQPFDVGGESLMYPGDPQGSDAEVLNCRCTTVYGDSLNASAMQPPTPALSSAGTMDETPEVTPATLVLRDFHLTAAAGEPTRWQGILLVEGELTEDGRMVAPGATTWRTPFPLPLMAMTVTDEGHDGAELCGRIDQIWRATGDEIRAEGIFNDVVSPFAASIVQNVRGLMLNGVSVDPVGGEAQTVVVQSQPDYEESQETLDEIGQVQEPSDELEVFEDVEVYTLYTELILGGATICPFQAMSRARIDVVASADEEIAPLVSAFAASFSEVDPQSAPPADTAALTASVEAMTERSVQLEATLEDRLASVEAQQRAIIAHFVAADTEFQKLTPMARDIAALRETLERKPRHVEFKRDGDGRLAGLVEER